MPGSAVVTHRCDKSFVSDQFAEFLSYRCCCCDFLFTHTTSRPERPDIQTSSRYMVSSTACSLFCPPSHLHVTPPYVYLHITLSGCRRDVYRYRRRKRVSFFLYFFGLPIVYTPRSSYYCIHHQPSFISRIFLYGPCKPRKNYNVDQGEKKAKKCWYQLSGRAFLHDRPKK